MYMKKISIILNIQLCIFFCRGVILFAMVNGRLPFNDAQLVEMEEEMKMQRLRFERNISFGKISSHHVVFDGVISVHKMTKTLQVFAFLNRMYDVDKKVAAVFSTKSPHYWRGAERLLADWEETHPQTVEPP